MLALLQGLLPWLAAGLFFVGAGVCLHAVFVRPVVPRPGGDWPARRQLWRVAAAVLVLGLVCQTGFALAALHNSPGQPFAQALQNQFYGNTDARHYVDLAQYGYGTGEAFAEQYLMIVFFPLFPALLWVLSLGGLLPIWLVALLVQLPLACLAAAGLYALAARHLGGANARWAVAFCLLSPAAAFFWAPMTESLFLTLCVWYVVCLEQGRWRLCLLLGTLAGLTRAPGMLLSGLAAVELILSLRQSRRRPPFLAVAAMLAPAVGLGGYFLLNFAVYGNWQQYAIYQREHWNNALGLFTQTVRYHLAYLAAWWNGSRGTAVWLCLAAVLCILFALGLLALAARRLPPAYVAYGLAYTAITTGVTWLISAPRYAVVLFPLPMALAALTEKHPRLRACVLLALTVGGAAYTWQYLRHGPIY